MHDLGPANQMPSGGPSDRAIAQPIATANCPTRRPPRTYGLGLYTSVNNWRNINMPTGLAKLDYAANAGSTQSQFAFNRAVWSRHTGISLSRTAK